MSAIKSVRNIPCTPLHIFLIWCVVNESVRTIAHTIKLCKLGVCLKVKVYKELYRYDEGVWFEQCWTVSSSCIVHNWPRHTNVNTIGSATVYFGYAQKTGSLSLKALWSITSAFKTTSSWTHRSFITGVKPNSALHKWHFYTVLFALTTYCWGDIINGSGLPIFSFINIVVCP